MSRNGAGVYSLPAGSTVSNGDVSDQSDLNTPLADIEADLNTPRPIVAGGTGASSASAARTALGLAIGTDVQAYNAALASIAGLTTAADRMIYTTASNVYAVTTLSSFARTILDDADAATVRGTIGAQASDAALTSLAGLSLSAGDVLYATGADTLERLAIGTAGQVLRVNSGATAPEWGDGKGYTMLTPIATTSGTAFDFTIPSSAREIIVLMDGISTSGSDNVLVQLIDGGGARTTGYISTSGLAGSNFTVDSTSGFVMYSPSAAGTMTGALRATLMTGFRWISDHSGIRGPTVTGMVGGGSVTLDDACVGVRFTRSGTNTFDAGQVTVGYR